MSAASEWDRSLEAAVAPAPLLQSWAWGEVQAKAGWAVERVRLDAGAWELELSRSRSKLLRLGRSPRPAAWRLRRNIS